MNDTYMDLTISIGDGLAPYGRYSACVVEENGLPMAESGALDDARMGYGDTPLAAAIALLERARYLAERRASNPLEG